MLGRSVFRNSEFGRLIQYKILSVYPKRWNSISNIAKGDVLKTRKPLAKNSRISDHSLRRSSPSRADETASTLLNVLKADNVPNKMEALKEFLSPVTSITVSESIDLEKLKHELEGKVKMSAVIPDEVLNIHSKGSDLMVLANGSVVGWGLTETEIVKEFVPLVKGCLVNEYEYESEEMDWIELKVGIENNSHYGSYMEGEIMVIQGDDEVKKVLDKAAFAVGFSRSTRLAILESALERHILLTRKTSDDLAVGKSIDITEKDVLRFTGRLFLLRGKLNLYSELIETPDLYWTEPTLERIYESISKNLDISSRIAILNRKLDYATEEQRALLSLLNERKSTRLEWVIIVLIMVEVCFETFHFYEKYSAEKHTSDETRGSRSWT